MDFMDIITKHRGKIIGIALGLVFALLIIKYGFLKTFFIAFCVGIGYYIGKRIDERIDLKETVARLFRKD